MDGSGLEMRENHSRTTPQLHDNGNENGALFGANTFDQHFHTTWIDALLFLRSPPDPWRNFIDSLWYGKHENFGKPKKRKQEKRKKTWKMENIRSEAIRYDWIHTRVYKIRENFDIFKVFKMDSMKMDEKKRFGSWIFETSEPFQRRLNGPLENGKRIENISEQQQDNETMRLKADWLGKSRRVNHLQSTRDRHWNQRWHWLQNGKRRRSWTTIIWSTPNFWFDTGYLNPLQCWTMVTDLWKSLPKTVSMAMVLLNVVDRQGKHKDKLFPNNKNNYNNISHFSICCLCLYNLSGRNSDGAKEEKWGEMWLASTVDGRP